MDHVTPADATPPLASAVAYAPRGALLDQPLYTPAYFRMAAASLVFMIGVSLQFHFGQFIQFLGHNTATLGWVLSVSMIGTLAMRVSAGRWIDRLGCGPIWLLGTLLAAASSLAMAFSASLALVGLLRLIFGVSTALAATTIPVAAAMLAPPHRRAESMGTMGISGFLGMMIGPAIGDLLFAGETDEHSTFLWFFGLSAAACAGAGAMVRWVSGPAAWRNPHRPQSQAASGDSLWKLALRTRFPLLVSLVFALAYCFQTVFLERLAEARGFKQIQLYFLTYAPTAMILRVIGRRLPERLGTTGTVALGMAPMILGILALIPVRSAWMLIGPGMLMGAGHSLVFPSLLESVAGRFPSERRGVGTATMLAAGDAGMLIGFAALGGLIDAFGFSAALLTMAALLTGAVATLAFDRPPHRTAPA